MLWKPLIRRKNSIFGGILDAFFTILSCLLKNRFPGCRLVTLSATENLSRMRRNKSLANLLSFSLDPPSNSSMYIWPLWDRKRFLFKKKSPVEKTNVLFFWFRSRFLRRFLAEPFARSWSKVKGKVLCEVVFKNQLLIPGLFWTLRLETQFYTYSLSHARQPTWSVLHSSFPFPNTHTRWIQSWALSVFFNVFQQQKMIFGIFYPVNLTGSGHFK